MVTLRAGDGKKVIRDSLDASHRRVCKAPSKSGLVKWFYFLISYIKHNNKCDTIRRPKRVFFSPSLHTSQEKVCVIQYHSVGVGSALSFGCKNFGFVQIFHPFTYIDS